MAASTWSVVVDEILMKIQQNGNYTSYLNKICLGIKENQLKFYEFVELLGQQLSNTEEGIRANGCKLLSEVLHKQSFDYLNTQEVKFLSTFLRDRLQDKDSVVTHALHGIVAMTKMSNISEEDAIVTMFTLMHEIGQLNQTRTMTDRRNVYLIFYNLLQYSMDALKTMGLDFISGFIQAIDGEKDPRNLLIVFGMIPKIVQNFDIDAFAEDLFEVTGCYFPIDYSPPPNDTKGVTQEELILGLRKCLASTPKFAAYCLPMLMEKMDSDVPSAKIDALLTLAQCAEVYGAERLRSFYVDSYQSIRREVCSNGSAEIEKAALTALTALVKSTCATDGIINDHDDFSQLISEILIDCLNNLCQPGLKLTHASAKLLQSTAIASDAACSRVITTVIPLLLEQFTTIGRSRLQEQVKLLDILNGFLETCRHNTEEDPSQFRPLAGFKSQLLGAYLDLLKSSLAVDLTCAAVIGSRIIATIPFFLDEGEVAVVIELLFNVAVHAENRDVRQESVDTVSKVAHRHPLTSTILLPQLFDVIRTMDATNEVEIYKNRLSLLAALIRDTESFQEVMLGLLNELSTSFTEAQCGSLHDTSKGKSIVGCCLGVARKTLAEDYWGTKCVPFFLDFAYSRWKNLAMTENEEILWTIAEIFKTVLPPRTDCCPVEALRTTLRVFTSGKTETDDGLYPMTIAYVECLHSCTRSKDMYRDYQIVDLLNETFIGCLTIIQDPNLHEDALCLFICRFLASLVNKMCTETDVHMNQRLNHLKSTVTVEWIQKLETTITVQWVHKNPTVLRRIVTLLIWVTKGLIMRGHDSTSHFIDKMFDFLNEVSTCDQVAEGFQFILAETEKAPTAQFHTQRTLFYKQRFFVSTSTRLIAGFESSDSQDIRYAHLKALILQLPLLPKEALVSELPMLIPILIKGMICDRANILIPILTSLGIIIKQDTKLVESYADTLIPRLIKLSRYEGIMKVRLAALENLNHLTKLPVHLSVQYKQSIISGLASILDDHKRLVRKAAVTARANWFLLGSPGGI